MTALTVLYNELPTLGDADERFSERENIFLSVRDLLAQYNHVWGLCLVHAHCKLEKDEVMLGRGNVSQPEVASNLGEYYPERWLSSGTPYVLASTTLALRRLL
ncbi:hypothetical protein INS49_001437 [Diaporthe citri]|uniref:uncharacterized protein n=1 Tax=Diaporthe citri TaxID=83186 RepID=UPI001C826C01|nr:uncharacterized protein INS49_001437 [Diaporthe citri]KAG6367251.1 hypothetical protein INS49_001437 [Diaporthe citri]